LELWVRKVSSGRTSSLRKNAAVILSAAKDLALGIFVEIRDSSSPAAPQNDSVYQLFRSLLGGVAEALALLERGRPIFSE
jgi:type IV secretory pathway VirB2 component (pilin)